MNNDPAAIQRALALAAVEQGNLDRATMHMRQCCDLAPESADYHFQLGSLLAHQGSHQEALDRFNRVVLIAPRHHAGWWFLGKTLLALGRGHKARFALRNALALKPDSEAVVKDLAEAEFKHGFPQDALPLWEKLARLHSRDLNTVLKTGESLSRLGFHERATRHFEDALSDAPRSPDLWMALAQALENENHRAAAERAYRRVLELKSGWNLPLACLVELVRHDAPPEVFTQATAAFCSPSTSDEDRALLGYALGKYHDARGEFREAFQCWAAANAARQRMGDDMDPFASPRTERILRQFPQGLPAPAVKSVRERLTPVFIVGMPRSGTTLTEQILASHPSIHACGELPDIALIARDLPQWAGSRQAWPEISPNLDQATLGRAANHYSASAQRHMPAGATHLVDKEPLNFYYLGLIAMMLPQAKVIWCRRDPRDIAISIYGENFAMDESLTTSLEGIAQYINQQQTLMRHWQKVLPLPILEVEYERLVAGQEEESRRMIEFLDLPWAPSCLEFHRSERTVQTPSRWQVKQPVHSRSVGRWRNYSFALDPLLDGLDPDAFPGKDKTC